MPRVGCVVYLSAYFIPFVTFLLQDFEDNGTQVLCCSPTRWFTSVPMFGGLSLVTD